MRLATVCNLLGICTNGLLFRLRITANQHRIAVTKEVVLLAYRLLISIYSVFYS